MAAVSLTSTVVSNVVTYDETIKLINPPSTVKDGMTADVSVVDQTATNVLVRPERSDHDDRHGLDRRAAPEREDDGHAGDHGPRR